VALIYAAGLSVVRDLARTDTSTEAPQLPYQLLEGEEMSIGGVSLGVTLTAILRHSSSVMA